ncbi:MAG TPA: phosphate ABC transporter substrate-binding protein PstS [Solirubrobacteraceae bacterium]|nr:phosphate ABC transporter substrate-binding protein PstS [Solirubrobacteraceae bacterium]
MKLRGVAAVAAVIGASLALGACGSSSSSTASGSSGSSSSAASSTGSAKTLVGAGSTLVAPLVAVWEPLYLKANGVTVTYGAVGSGGGIESITGRDVDFGASDAPMTPAQATACKSCVEIPWALAATVVAYHVSGVPNGLHFTGPVLADIWLGKIKTWNNPAIQSLNPGVKLPSTAIVPVHRTDGSGDTYAFTNYLGQVSPTFKSQIGPPATSVAWPGGIGGKGNSGVGGVLSSTNGAIAYIAIAYVLENNFDYGLVENAAGKFPTPGIPSISAAADALKSVPAGGTQGISIVNPPASAPAAYPISTFTYIIAPTTSSSSGVGSALKKFIDWAVTTGQASGPKLDFAPLPAAVVSAAQADAALLK